MVEKLLLSVFAISPVHIGDISFKLCNSGQAAYRYILFTTIFFNFLNIYSLYLRERETASRGGTEKEEDTEFEAGSRL